MTRSRRLSHLVLAGALGLLWAAPAPAGEVCDPDASRGSVSLVILKSPAKVKELARSVAKSVPVVAQDDTTVVFSDGRVVTSDVEAAGRTLNRLGWGARPIEVSVSFASRRSRPARRRG